MPKQTKTPLFNVTERNVVERLVEPKEYREIEGNYVYETREELVERLEAEIERQKRLIAKRVEADAKREKQAAEYDAKQARDREDAEAARVALRAIVDNPKADASARVEAARDLARFQH